MAFHRVSHSAKLWVVNILNNSRTKNLRSFFKTINPDVRKKGGKNSSGKNYAAFFKATRKCIKSFWTVVLKLMVSVSVCFGCVNLPVLCSK
jgi:hypothetical protein